MDDMRPSRTSGTDVMLLTNIMAPVRPRMCSLTSCMIALTFLLQADKQKRHASIRNQSALQRTHSMLTSCIIAAIHVAANALIAITMITITISIVIVIIIIMVTITLISIIIIFVIIITIIRNTLQLMMK